MKSSRINSFQFFGMEKQTVHVEAVKTRGLANLSISGLPDTALKESREKIKNLVAQIHPWGPMEKVMVELSPAELNKTGRHLELPIALACLAVLDKELEDDQKQKLQSYSYAAEISLNGSLRNTTLTDALDYSGIEPFIGAAQFNDLQQMWEQIKIGCPFGEKKENTAPSKLRPAPKPVPVEGRVWERFCLLSAAVAELPVLLLGPPGIGKSHLSQWISSVYPQCSNKLQSQQRHIWRLSMEENPPRVPVVVPHAKTLLSEFKGVQRAQTETPGLFSLAHGGVLILDEFAEMNRDVREILRNVIDTKQIEKNSRLGRSKWPADFWLLMTSNPCPCGFARGIDLSQCRCPDSKRIAYQNRISGPVLSRMGLFLYMDEDHRRIPSWLDPKVILDQENFDELIASSRLKMKEELSHCRDQFNKYTEQYNWKLSQRKVENNTKIFTAMHILSGAKASEILPIMLLQQNSSDAMLKQ